MANHITDDDFFLPVFVCVCVRLCETQTHA